MTNARGLSAYRSEFAILIIASLAACSDAPATTGGWTGTIDTLTNGAVLVSNPGQGIWSQGEEWTFVEELRIGSATVQGPELFGRVADIAADELGRIYVADSQANEIRVFAEDGQHIRTFGGKGAGPGEFEQIAGMEWGRDGNLWIMDTRNSRFTVYDTTGTFVTSHLRPGGFIMLPWPGGVDLDGNLYDVGMGSGAPGEFSPVLVRFDSTMQPADTFRIPQFEGEQFTLTSPDGRSRMASNVPFSPTQVWRLDPEGHIWSGISDQYRLHRTTFGGDTVRIIEREFTPAAVTSADRDDALENLEWFTEQGGKVDASRIPEVKPAFSTMFADQQGYLWVDPNTNDDDVSAYDIFDPQGRYLGLARFPVEISNSPRPVISGDHLFAVVEDELEVPYVVRFRIEGRDNLAASGTAP